MCGIVGMFLRRPLTEADIQRGREGRDRLAHRGPDGAGEWFDRTRGIYLGHRRLAVIDTTDASRQPMVADGSVIAYNGELYNFVELRNELSARQISFQTSGDTEVVVRAWQAWGPAALDRFDGMFALALFDGTTLHLATDPFGEKPLFWAQTEDGVWFASEAQVLVQLLKLRFQPTQSEAEAFLALGFIPAPATGYPRLFAVPAATHLVMTPAGIDRARSYWVPAPATVRKGRPAPLQDRDLDRLHAALVTSTKRRIRADVPLGLFLSAGVDSALVGSIVAKDLGLNVEAFTVAFPDGRDESAAAARIAVALGLPHTVIDSREADDWRNAPASLQDMYGTPNDNLTALSVRQMSAVTRRRITVALSGVGGDEIFYGYNRYDLLWRRRRLYRTLAPLLEPVAGLRAAFGWSVKLRAAFETLAGPRAWQYLAVKNNALGDVIRRLPEAVSLIAAEFPPIDRDIAFQARDFDVRRSLPGSYLPSVDRGSMRVGLEVRTPYLSRAVYDEVAALDHRSLIHPPKIALRRILARYLPRDLFNRPKQGFVFPVQRYLALRGSTAPTMRNVPTPLAALIWERRADARFQALAFRLDVLASFAA